MKSFKRFAALGLAAAVLFCFVGCSLFTAVETYSLYSKAYKKLKKAGGFEADCTMTFKLNLFGEDFSVDTESNLKKNGDDSQETVFEGGIKSVTTRIGDKVYKDNALGKRVYHVSKSDTASKDKLSKNLDLPDLAKDLFDGVSSVKLGDGKTLIKLELDSESAKPFLKAFEEQVADLSVNDIVIEMIFDKKGDLESIKCSCTPEVERLGMKFSCDVIIEYRFVNFGTAPEITLPSDVSEYTDGGEYTG